MLKNEPLKVVKGVFNNNEIVTDDGEIIPCVTYGIVYEKIKGKSGFFHLKKFGRIKDWTIFQYVLID